MGALASQSFVAKRMDEWQLTPEPEQVTELYFSNYSHLPDRTSASTQKVAFTVRNLEHQTTRYHYTLSAISEDTAKEYIAKKGTFSLPPDRAHVVHEMVVIPHLEGRIAVTVSLGYDNTDFAQNRPVSQKQSIHYWTMADQPDAVKVRT